MVVVRGLAGLVLGIGYGVLAGALTFLFSYLTVDRPGPMIPDNYGWGLMVTVYTTLITGVCGAVVGLIVGLSGVGKTEGGIVGGGLGLAILLFFWLISLPELGMSWEMWKELLNISFFLLLLFPLGLTLTGVVVSVLARKLKQYEGALRDSTGA